MEQHRHQESYQYVLYYKNTSKEDITSLFALFLVQWEDEVKPSSQLSKNGFIRKVDVETLKERKEWMVGTPILARLSDKILFRGTECLKKLKEIEFGFIKQMYEVHLMRLQSENMRLNKQLVASSATAAVPKPSGSGSTAMPDYDDDGAINEEKEPESTTENGKEIFDKILEEKMTARSKQLPRPTPKHFSSSSSSPQSFRQAPNAAAATLVLDNEEEEEQEPQKKPEESA